MGRQENESYARIILLLMEGGIFIAREILKRETQKNEGNLKDFLRSHQDQLKRRFTEEQMNEILPIIGEANPDDWDMVLLTGVLLEVFRTTLSSREKREILVIRNVRDELQSHITSVSLDEETFVDLRTQLEEALNNLSAGLEPALVANCQRIINRYLHEPIHMPSSLEHLHNMCRKDEDFEDVVKMLRQETRNVVDDILDLVKKAEDEGRELKQPKVVEYIIKPECKHKGILECVESALMEISEDSANTGENQGDYAKVKNELEDTLEEIKLLGDVFTKYEKGKGIVIRIECKTYEGLLDTLSYMESLHCIERIEMIAAALKEQFSSQERLCLTCTFCEENMKSVYEAIKTENVEYSRSISLSMRVNTLQGLVHMWDMFEGGGAQNHLNNIAEALSEYLGSKITLKASLDVHKFKQALEEAVGQPLNEMAKEAEARKSTETDQDNKEKKTEAVESDEKTEESSPQAGAAAAPSRRRGVEIIAVKPGTRKTTLFDETISEGERDEISEMGFDTRDKKQTTKDEINEGLQPAEDDVTADRPCEEQPVSTAGPTNEENTPAPQVAEIPSEEISNKIQGAVDSFYRDIVYMTSRTGNYNAGQAPQAAAENKTPSVTEMHSDVDSTPQTETDVTRPTETRSSAQMSQSLIKQEKPGTRNIQETDMSLRLSSALDACGINEDMLNQQQNRIQTSESIMNQMAKVSDRQVIVNHYGSHAEGTTMIGLPSNVDTMVVLEKYSVLQNTYSLDQPSQFGKIILGDDTRPGFMHLPLTDAMYTDILNESTLLCGIEPRVVGPGASTRAQQVHCGFGADTVLALKMSAWPLEIKRAFQQRTVAWVFDASSEDMTSQAMTVVPYNSSEYLDDEMEWRISTAHVERVLMNSLNIHQRRVFILFRIILKYLVNPQLSLPLTSYMIKNIFLHMAASTWPDMWNEANLILCLNGCLNKTRQFLRANSLPNFFIQKENLVQGRLSLADRSRADEIILQICNRPYASIASIQDGNVGNILAIQSSVPLQQPSMNKTDTACSFLRSLRYDTCLQIITYKDFLLEWIVERSTDEKSAVENHYTILHFLKNYISRNENEKSSLVANIASQYISTSLASHLICLAFKTENTTERDWHLCTAAFFFYKGMESDALSSKLKFITALTSMNQLTSAREMLVDIEISDDIDSNAVCACRWPAASRSLFIPEMNCKTEKSMKNLCSCVTFLPTESLITPLAMRYEMYSLSTRAYRTNPYDLKTRYRKWAVADAKVYFGFLNTVLYSTIEDMEMFVGTPDLHHKETLMNFLGLFSEYIGELDKAAAYYRESIDHAPTQNVAHWYISLLLFRNWYRVTQAQSMIQL